MIQKKMIYFITADHKKKAKMFKKYGYYFNELNKCLNFMNSKPNLYFQNRILFFK